MSKHGRVLVAMSGGVDSSVAAVMLHEQGYEVVGLTMKTWDYATSAPVAAGKAGKQVGCCSLDAMNDARAVALRHGFTHFIVDLREEFGDGVVETFTSEYLAGRTPNPCVLCNTHIKWAALLRRADRLGCDHIATGHYANVRHEPATGRHVVSRGRDRAKDQSYVLWGLPQPHLARSLFPLGAFEKPAIRQRAADWGLDEVAAKPDSYEICFVPDDDYRGFLRRRVPGLDERVAGGAFVLEDGTPVGTHAGYPFYTVGQRHGLGLALGYPAYVTHIAPDTNTITVGPREALLRQRAVVRGVNYVGAAGPLGETAAWAQVRAHDAGAPCLAWAEEAEALTVAFAEPRAVTPGQSLVLYDGDDVLAGGWVRDVTSVE